MNHELRQAVLVRDGFACVAPRLGAGGYCYGALELDHVRPKPHFGEVDKAHPAGGFGKRPPDAMENLVTLCRFHHQGGWATAHRPELRAYLRQKHAIS